MTRREFLNKMGVTVGVASLGSLRPDSYSPLSWGTVKAAAKVPDKPFKVGHMTFLSGFAAVYGAPSLKGHLLAAEEINARGGLLGRRPIETLQADEAAGTDANVREFRRMKLQGGIEAFTGVISSSNTLALAPLAEELGVLTIFTDGCTDTLFDHVLPNPKHVFRITNIQSADAVTCAVAVGQVWPDVRRVAHLHPDYAYGRDAFRHFNVALRKLIPQHTIVYEGWPKLGETDFSAHITKILAAKPDLVVVSVWGGDYLAFYQQALGYGLFKQARVAALIAFSVVPSAIGKDHPEGIIGGVHANYYWAFPPYNQWPPNTEFVRKYYARWKEYPNMIAEGAYTATHMLRIAIEKAYQLTGEWPSNDAIIAMLEGLSFAGPAGYVHIRPDNHQGYKDAITGFTKNHPDYPFQILDPERIIQIPIRSITAPPGWPKKDPTAAYAWIQETWPELRA